MRDYAVMISGLPQLEGSEPVEEELKADRGGCHLPWGLYPSCSRYQVINMLFAEIFDFRCSLFAVAFVHSSYEGHTNLLFHGRCYMPETCYWNHFEWSMFFVWRPDVYMIICHHPPGIVDCTIAGRLEVHGNSLDTIKYASILWIYTKSNESNVEVVERLATPGIIDSWGGIKYEEDMGRSG